MTTKKFPLSLNGIQCIGPCYEPNVEFIHPITYNKMISNKSSCPVNDLPNIIDDCFPPTANKNEFINIIPIDIFDNRMFLKHYYNVSEITYEYCIKRLLEMKNEPIFTRMRFIYIIFMSIDNIEVIDNVIIDCFVEYMKKIYFKLTYKNPQYIDKQFLSQFIHDFYNKYKNSFSTTFDIDHLYIEYIKSSPTFVK